MRFEMYIDHQNINLTTAQILDRNSVNFELIFHQVLKLLKMLILLMI